MADTAWLAPSIPINFSTHLRLAPIYLSMPIERLLPIQARAVASFHPPPTPTLQPAAPRRASTHCRLPASCAPGILELEVVVDDQFSEFSEGKIRGCRVRSVVGERRLKRFRA